MIEDATHSLNVKGIHIASALLACLCWMAGCKATAAPESGYLANSGEMKKRADSPFDRSWLDRKIDESNYTELLVRPVNIQYVKAQNIWEQASVRDLGSLHKDFEEIAAYTRKAFIDAAEKDPKHRFKVVQTAGPKTAVLELAIVQLVPSKAGLNAIGLIGPIASGSVMALEIAGGAVTNSQDSGEGVIAIEGRIRDGATGKVIYMFADRERGQMAALNIAEYTWWEPERRIIDIWAKDLIELASTPANQRVKEPATFELLLW
jgi:Protein of unknown function (DUF3313)